jgi:transposase
MRRPDVVENNSKDTVLKSGSTSVVDFRKSINGLVVIVEQEMALSPFSEALFVFCNRNRDRMKVLYWDRTGFACGINAWRKRSSNGHANNHNR